MKTSLTPFSKLLIVVAVLAAVFGAYKVAENKGLLKDLVPQAKQTQNLEKGTFSFSKASDSVPTENNSLKRPLRVGVVSWGGYIGGEYFNRGFKPNENSLYKKNYNLDVEFVLIDDYDASRAAFKSGDIDVLWTTVDSFPTEVANMKSLNPKLIFQSDWSRGGDAIVARRGINQVSDLKGKKVSVAFGTPSHTFLLWMLDAGDLKYSDITVVQAPSAIDSATYFKSGKVDSAVVWSPDDKDCATSVPGAKILKSTKEASNIIADAFYVRDEFLQAHSTELRHLVEGWLKGAAEINSSEVAKHAAAKILSVGLKQPEEFCYDAINNARLATYGDNVNFFNLHGNATGVTGEQLYTHMAIAYNKIGLAPDNIPAWRSITDTSLLLSINLDGAEHAAEQEVRFTKVVNPTSLPAFATKRVSVVFPTGSAQLDDNAKLAIQTLFGDVAKGFARSRIRIEGNTDNTGSAAVNKSLSLRRAHAVADFLINENHFDADRFLIVGNGPDKPVDTNATEAGRAKNRRTDFELLSE